MHFDDDKYAGVTDPDEVMDYYCDLCDAHMNSIQMWESHVTGKRHLKNKKKPGEPSKIKSVARDDVPSILNRLLRDVHEPIVGLGYMSELQRSEPGVDPSYTCYICHGTFTKLTVIQHLVSSKHRLNYLKAVDQEAYNYLSNLKLSTTATDSLLLEKASDWEEMAGRGVVEVKVEKPRNISSAVWFYENMKHTGSRDRKEQPESSRLSVKKEPPISRSSTASALKTVNTVSSSASKNVSTTSVSKSAPNVAPVVSKCTTNVTVSAPPTVASGSKSADASAPSTSNQTSSSAQATLPEPEQKATTPITESKGIEDVDLLRDVGMCSTELQMELLEYLLVKEPPPIETQKDISESLDLLNRAKQVLLKWHVDRMTLEEQQRYVDDVVKGNEDPVYKEVFGPVNMKKMDI